MNSVNRISLSEVARSIEIYNLTKYLVEESKKGKTSLRFVKEPFLIEEKTPKNVLVAFGSYDPLSISHETLFIEGLEAIKSQDYDSNLCIVTSVNHFDKKPDFRKNSTIYDRIHSLEGFASCYGNVSIALFNKPLFVDLLDSLKEKYSDKSNIYFLMGADVLEKILNPESYTKRGLNSFDTLEKLFSNSKLISADRTFNFRGSYIQVSAKDLIKEYCLPKNFADKIITLEKFANTKKNCKLELNILEVSSTLIRQKRAEGKTIKELEAVGIGDFLDRRSIYLSDTDQYASFVCARQRFADKNNGKPIADYILELMKYLSELENSPALQQKEIKSYLNEL